MTNYAYLNEMQNLCLRAGRACEVTDPDSYFAHFYQAAEEGFFTKKINMPAEKAVEDAGPAQDKRLKEFKQAVIELEEKAAYVQKDSGGKK